MVGAFEQAVLAAMMFFIMLGMGAALTPRDFQLALRRPYGMFIGLVSQYGFLPLIGLMLALILPVSDPVKIGIVIMSCMPGGTTSNIFTYFAKGNLALSVLMTINSTVVGIIAIPLLVTASLGILTATGNLNVVVPTQNIVLTLIILLAPVIIGVLIRRWNANVGALVELTGGALGIFFIMLLLLTWVPRNWQFLLSTPPSVFAGVIGLGVLGFAAGYLFAIALKLGRINAQTISMEIGIQNGPLAIAVVVFTIAGPLAPIQQQVLAIPALYSLFIVITATLATIWYRRINEAAEQKVPNALL
jgi:bile acid:Na+ symporter, BASS family